MTRTDQPTLNPTTCAVRGGLATDEQFGAVVPPIHLSSNFTFRGFDEKRVYDYSRSGNPTRDLLSQSLATLEEGAGAVITPSGMAAVALVLQRLQPGQRVVAAHDLYGGTHRLLSALADRGAFDVHFVDLTADTATNDIEALAPQLVWAETPSNPLLRITDLAVTAQACRRVGAQLVVDNTFLSPALQQPLTLGADIVVHSTTKYINGHSDVVGGAVVARTQDAFESLSWWANCLGITGSPFDSFLTLRGLRTLQARLRVHQENAAAVVDLLSRDPRVQQVHYPGLPAHPGHTIARQQQAGFGAMVSFELADGRAAVRPFVSALEVFSLAESLGGVESLVAHPATMTHAAMVPEARRQAGITDSLVRLSVGIEHPADLCHDLRRGLNAIQDRPAVAQTRCHASGTRKRSRNAVGVR